MYKDLFANVAIVISFLLVTGQFLKKYSMDKVSLSLQGILGVAFGFMGIVLMVYTVHVTDTTIVDMRNMVIISSGIIGGPFSVLIVSIILAIFRLLYFGVNTSSIVAVLVALICGTGCAYLSNTKLMRKAKFVYMFSYIMLISTGALIYLLADNDKIFCVLAYYYAISFIVAMLSFFAIEYIISSNKSSKTMMYYGVMADNMSDMLSTHGTDGTFKYVSPSSIQLSGYLPEELIGKKLDFCVHYDDLQSITKYLTSSVIAASHATFVYQLRKKSGEYIWVESAARIIKNKEGEVKEIVCVSRDITERKHKENELKRVNEDIMVQKSEVEKQKMAALEATQYKSIFLAHMSHEIRTPINGIIGFLDLLSQSDLSLRQREYIKEIKAASEVLQCLINDILDLSKIEAGRLDIENIVFNVKGLIEDVVRFITPKAHKKGLLMNIHVSPAIPDTVLGDPIRLRQVFHNLLSNAVKFTETGEITLRADIVSVSAGDLYLSFEVKDTGIGISEENMNRLFKPFSQVDASTTRKYGGTGLGLAISNELVKLMGGTMQVTSELEKGSSFSFTIKSEICRKNLPVYLQHGGTKQSYADTDSDGARRIERKGIHDRSLKILLADDNEMNIKLVQSLLKSKGLACDIAINGSEAVKACRENDYDIIFMDCQMPVMDGYQATAAIRTTESGSRNAIIVAITASAMVGDREKCIASGMDDYLTKPVTMKSFFGIIDKYLKTDMLKGINEITNVLITDRYTDNIDTVVERLVVEAYFELSDAINTINKFINKLPSEYSNLGYLIAEGNIDDCMKLIHKLKGTSINLRMPGLNEIMAEFEAAMKERGAGADRIYMDMFKKYMEQVL